MWDPKQQKFWVATNRSAFNKQPSVTECRDIENVYINVEELAQLIQEGHPHCDPVGLNQQGRPGWTEEMAKVAGPFIQRPYKKSPRTKNNSYLTNLVVLESDGDGPMQAVLNDEELCKYLTLVYTSSSHGKKPGKSSDRFRMVFVLGRRLETFHDSDEYSNPHWQLEAVWDYLHIRIAKALGIDELTDKAGREAARQFFGCNSAYKIGLGELKNEYPEPCQVFFPGGGVDALKVNQILDEAESRYVKQTSPTSYTFDSDFEGNDELSERDANIINWILMNGVLKDEYATNRDRWFTVGRVLKKYDPDGVIFFDGFVAFSQQCTDPSKRDSADQLRHTWEQLPNGEDTVATFNCIKTYATESNEEWRKLCPYYGGTTTMTKATKPFVSGSISLVGTKALEALEVPGGLQEYEAILAHNFEVRAGANAGPVQVQATGQTNGDF